jgi:glycosyltransferase involved in cell wall biosynthesis
LNEISKLKINGFKKLIVAQVCPRYYPYIGGVETHVKEISERLHLRDVNVEVMATDPKGDLPQLEEINGVSIRRFKSWAPGEAYYFSNGLDAYLKRVKGFDIIHAHSYHAFPALYAARRAGKAKFIFTPHYHAEGHTPLRRLLHRPYKTIGAGIYKRAEKVISVSEYEKNLILRNFSIDDEKIDVIPNGVNKDEFKGFQSREKNHRTILCVSRLEEYKGIQHIIQVLPELDRDIHLEIIGKGSYEPKLISMIYDLNIKDRVHIIGGIDRNELLQKYFDADLFILLSRNEAYGITVAEALTAGTPCILANASALADWVDDDSCYGIDLPINLAELKLLIEKIIGRRVSTTKILDWNDVTNRLVILYSKISDR